MLKKVLIGISLIGFLTAGPIALNQTHTATTNPDTTLEKKVEKSFPNKEIKDIEDFMQYNDDIMEIVGKEMGYEIDENIPKPTIITDKQITQKEFNNNLGYPDDFFDAMCPIYFHKINTILILSDSKLYTLAHEYVHYFQVKYRGENPTTDPDDHKEYEAVTIQHWFEDKYLEKD